MEISREQLIKLGELVGKEKLEEIIPNAFIPKFDNSKIYIYDNRYKLHRVGEDYAWIDLRTSNCFANGVATADDLIRYAGSYLKVFDSYRDFIIWSHEQLLEK